MTLYKILLESGVDVKDIKSKLGNELVGQLALNQYQIDFDKPIEDITEEDLYQIGRVLVLYHDKSSKAYFRDEIIETTRSLFHKVKVRLQENNLNS